MTVRVQSEHFDAGAELNSFAQDRTDIGAVVSFTGVVRDTKGDLQEMLIEHYPGMTQSAITKIADEAVQRWALVDVLVIHRYGPLKPGEPIMMVATASAHRAAAFEAADFLMDYLKSRAPFWKKEVTNNGASWVDAKDADEDALKRW
ncbi:molybdopterin synthase subunit MoaE [Yoonia maricola]|uniref:Molybdopterin synthase catalytic subunit n=1 Tax=Yoonia maricola TaxID=420999 RepID=A0A2M8W5P4_9RHOB|nr:molybdenum cofactor biosynthesis protein MoaE [Yoonia maricola]PJI86255.1 molybdopterin synthase subunit MoaE [Yoonia maricola]